MTIQEKLDKIIKEYSDPYEREYDLTRIAKEAFNLGIEFVAEQAKLTTFVDCCSVEDRIDREAILKLKI